jgi:beta-N-acetylhexosaminidase
MIRHRFRSLCGLLLPLLLLLAAGGCGILPFQKGTPAVVEADSLENEITEPVISVQPMTSVKDSLLADIAVTGYPAYNSRWVDSVLARLSPRQRVAQLLVPFSFSDVSTKTLTHLRKAVLEQGVGAVLLSRGTIADARELIDSLQGWAEVPLLISADFETGPGMRLSKALELPTMMALAATRSTDLAYRAGRAVADESRDIGVQLNFAPVADINSNPGNPIINTRSFGEDRELVADMAEAYLRGMQDGGLIATAKHFPGHGDTETDSHSGLPVTHVTPGRLDSLELYPFRRLINAGALAVMTAHVAVPALTGDSSLPATLSRVMLDSLLRRSMDFRGLIVTDAMNMKALQRTGIANLPATALAAGADLLLIPGAIDETIDSILAAEERGEIDSMRIARSVRRVLALKQWSLQQEIPIDSIATRPDRFQRHRRLADRIAERAVTVLRNTGSLIPLVLDSMRIGVLNLVRKNEPAAATLFRNELEKRGATVRVLTVPMRAKDVDVEAWKGRGAAEFDAIVISSYIAVADGSGSIGFSQKQREVLERVAKLPCTQILLSFGSPYIVASLPDMPVIIVAYGDDLHSIRAAVRVLSGEVPPQGKLPITIPGLFSFGDGVTAPQHALAFPAVRFARVDKLVTEQIDLQAFPGAQLLVLRNDSIMYDRCYGNHTYDSASTVVSDATLYDLASLTKVVATTPAAMKLVDEHRLCLDSAVSTYLPAFGKNGKEGVKIRNLLLHNSGLEAYRLFYLTIDNEQEVLDSIYSSALKYPTGSKTVYSDLGMVTLAKVVERITGMSLDTYVEEQFFKPLGMSSTMFRPPDYLRSLAAPTEYDKSWRKRLIQGEVHDPNAALLGGVAGHAGLFSTAHDLLPFVRMMLHNGTLDGKTYLEASTVRQFTTRQSSSSTRALGWDTRSVTGSSSGHYFSMKSYGHTGFTGTSIWVDPVADLAVIFLTNRVYPSASNKQQARFRSVLHDAVREALQELDGDAQ